MSYHLVRFWVRSVSAPQDGHDRCLTCLGIQHTEEAFVDDSCSSCGDMTISELRKSLQLCQKWWGPSASAAIWRSSWQPDLRITVRASPSGVPHPSSTPQPVGVPLDRTGASAEWGTPHVSFGAPPDDQMSIAAS